MNTCTDSLKLNDLKIFQVIRGCLPDDKKVTQNLVECKDDMLFAWNSKDCCVLATNWRMAKARSEERDKYQTLTPSAPQNFNVDKMLASSEGSYLAVSGQRGVSIIELPRRCGSSGQYQNGKESITCRSYNLDEYLFTNNKHLEVLQVRWHPSSPTDSHVLILLSDNSIRVYDADSLRHVWRIGPIPCALPPTGSQLPFLNSLGDTAVDFDIAPPRVVSSNNNFNDTKDNNSTFINESVVIPKNKKNDGSKVEWPIVILRGDGNIYILCAGIDTNRPHLQGPISILPQCDNNYGLDSCSLIVIPTLPPTIVIAESSGRIHHALLLEEENQNERSFNEIDASLLLYPSEWYLQVIETVELELGLPGVNDAKSYLCPVHLKKDSMNDARYFAYHNAGLHAITMDFIRQLQDFVENEDNSSNQHALFNSESRAVYVVCTKALKAMDINAVLGFTLLQSPSVLLLLLSSGQVVSLDLISDHNLTREIQVKSSTKDVALVESPLKKMLKDSFQDHIKNILKSGLSQPILKLDKSSEPTPQESFELLLHATQILREQYFTKHDKTRQEIEKRVHVLKILKTQQFKEIALLQKEKETIRDKAERLAENYEDICDKQNALSKRTQELVRLATLRLPKGSFSEKKYAETIEKINNANRILTKNVEHAKLKITTQQLQMNQKHNIAEKCIILPPKQEKIVQQIISEMSTEIESQIKDVKKINNHLSLS